MSKKNFVVLLLGAALLGGLFCDSASARMLYDDFSGTYVDDQKWMNQWTDLTEIVREVSGGQLIAKVGNNTKTLIARNSASLADSTTILSIQCDIAVEQTQLDSGDGALSFARVNGFFYNTQGSGGATGDVWAGVYIGDRGNGLEAWWDVSEALDDNQSTWDELDAGTLAVPNLSYGEAYTVKLTYDGSTGFTFSVAGVSATVNGNSPRLRDPVTAFKGLTVGAYGYSGATGDGYISAAFDNVYTNDESTAYDTFDAALDNSLWSSTETVLELADGRLRMNKQGYDQTSQVTARMSDGDASYVEATVRIDSDSVMPAGGWGFIRIQGYFYNERRGPGSGLDHNRYEGDVFADVRLRWFDDGSLGAQAYIGRSDNADESEWSDIAIYNFSTPIDFDTDYRLSIEYRNNQLVFGCNDETYSYPIATPEYPAYDEHRQLRSRVYLDPGEYGYIKTSVDDVYVDGDTVTDGGYAIGSDLWLKAILQVTGSPVTLVWKEVGTDTTPSGDKVISGYFYADPDDFAYGSVYNPEVFVKAYIATSGWANIAFNHVTVDAVDVSSALNYDGAANQSSTVTLDSRLAEHQYDGVDLQ